jgi:hypothetical protein
MAPMTYQIVFAPARDRAMFTTALAAMRVKRSTQPCKTFWDDFTGGAPTRAIGRVLHQPSRNGFPYNLRPRDGATVDDVLALARLAFALNDGAVSVLGAWLTMSFTETSETAPAIRCARYLSDYGDAEIATAAEVPDALPLELIFDQGNQRSSLGSGAASPVR